MCYWHGNDSIARVINEGRGVVTYRGHGEPSYWYTEANEGLPEWRTAEVDALCNGDLTPMVYNFCCHAGNISVAKCLSEAWLRKYPGGACGSFAAVTQTYDANDSMCSTMARALCDTWTISGGSRNYTCPTFDIGWIQCNMDAYVAKMWPEGGDNGYNATKYLNLGDPAMEVWSGGSPGVPFVDFPSAIPLGTCTTGVRVTVGGSPVENALVCLRQDLGQEFYNCRLTGPDGWTSLVLSPHTCGDVDVTVTGGHATAGHRPILPFLGTGQVRGGAGPLKYLRSSISDPPPGGNGNGYVGPGEQIKLPTWIKNNGTGPAGCVCCTLRSCDSFVTITDSVRYFSTIAAGDSAFSGPDGFHFTASDSCPAGYQLSFTLRCRDAFGESWDSPFTIPVRVGLPPVDDSLATWPSQARHLVRRPNSQELHIVYQSGGNVLYQRSSDGGNSWASVETVATGASPCVALDYGGQPWVSYNTPHQVHCAVRRSSTASPHWKDITVYGNENFAFGPASMVCSNIHDEVVPYPPDMGYLAFVTYSNSATETLGHGSLMIAAFDTLHTDPITGYHDWFCCPLDQWNQADSLDSMPCIARTPGDLIHVVWQKGSPLRGGRELSKVYYRTTVDAITPTFIRTAPYPFQDTMWSPAWAMVTDSGSCPFVEAWGDSVFAAYRYGGDHTGYYPGTIDRSARFIYHVYSRWEAALPQSVADTWEFVETPVMSARAAVVWRKSQYSGEKYIQDRFAGDQSPTLVYGTASNVAYPHADVQLAQPPLPWATPGPDILRALFTEQTGQNSYAVRVVRIVHSNANGATFYRVDVGDSKPSPYCISRSGCATYSSYKVDCADQTLKYGLAYLNPGHHYALRLKFYRGGSGTEMQVKLADSAITSISLPPGVLESLWVDVPQQFHTSSSVELDIARIQGASAVLAGLDVYQYEVFPQGGGGQQSGEINPLQIPKELVLEQSWPNPAVRSLTIRYGIPRPTTVSLKVYDISGKVVRTLEASDKLRPGYYNITWNCRDDRDRKIAGGVYFYRLATSDRQTAAGGKPAANVKIRKLVIAR